MIRVSEQPNSSNLHRYDVTAAGRATHGFRTSIPAARQAAYEDQELMHFAARSEKVEEDETVGKDRTTRRESVK